MKFIALLPMKGNSERVPNKNLKLFNNKPLYYYTLNTLLNSKYIDKVAINTDSKDIEKDVKNNFDNRVIILKRPEKICGDFVSMNTIINHDVDYFIDNTFFLQTHSTNPLLKTTTLDRGIEKFFEVYQVGAHDSVFSVTRFQTRFYEVDGRPINHDPNVLIRTQDLPILYEENSNFYIFTRESFKNNDNKRIGKTPFLFEIDKVEAIDIDELEDFTIAEAIHKTLFL